MLDPFRSLYLANSCISQIFLILFEHMALIEQDVMDFPQMNSMATEVGTKLCSEKSQWFLQNAFRLKFAKDKIIPLPRERCSREKRWMAHCLS